jgi:hypothetical protein
MKKTNDKKERKERTKATESKRELTATHTNNQISKILKIMSK